MDGERVAVELDIPQDILDHPSNRINLGKDRIYSSKIYLRVRKATPEDKRFIMTFNDIRRSKREGVYTDTSFKANADWLGVLKRESKRIDDVEVVSTNEKLNNDLTARINNCGEKILCHYTFTTRLISMVYVCLSLFLSFSFFVLFTYFKTLYMYLASCETGSRSKSSYRRNEMDE